MQGSRLAQRWIFQRQVCEFGAPRILKLDYPASAIGRGEAHPPDAGFSSVRWVGFVVHASRSWLFQLQR
ncbi:hypothetical protein [Paenibacillus roseipurpureus]|uniref:Uncharacterized protein n=1 Tax=Paenibacillus roseopurpureus TaxID=2918901 RepID=A0AA96RIE8_9BACL|nr:hypothetical protein [Paenibacillus sp. MBLB1832]WNR42710.1 hypothetical protein MJB10_16470 [Paenibacillus sp. MBLB1832]